MEIQYKRTYTPGGAKRYTLGEISAALGYAMEIADPRVQMKEGKMAPGQVCMLLFALTPEEYALKDHDAKALNRLAEKLLKQIPADRLLGWRIMDLKGAALQSTLQPQTGERVDGGEFARRVQAQMQERGPVDEQLIQVRTLQKQCASKDVSEAVKQELAQAKKRLGEALLGLETVYVAYDAATGRKWPAVGFDGRIELFTTEKRAQRVCEKLDHVHEQVRIWDVRAVQDEAFRKLLSQCGEDGLELLRVDNGFAAAELSLGDFCDCPPRVNASLRSMMIREVEYGMRWNQLRDANANEKVVRGALESMLTMRNFVWRELGNAKLYVLCVGGQREKCVLLSNRNQAEKLLAVFSDSNRALHFAKQMKEAALPVEMDFDALHSCAFAGAGMLLDVGFIGYRLLKADFDQVLELRGKPPMVVRVRPAEQAAAPQDKQELGELPDPDAYAPKQEAAAEQSKVETVAAENEAVPQHKGFLKKLFGKI